MAGVRSGAKFRGLSGHGAVGACGASAALGALFLRRDSQVTDEAQGLQEEQDVASKVHLVPAQANVGAVWEGVVVVVPAFAKAKNAEEGVVACHVGALVWPGADDVADAVDAPGDVVDEEHAHDAAPEEALPEVAPGAKDGEADESRHEDAGDDPEELGFLEEADDGVAHEAVVSGPAVNEVALGEPAEVTVPEAIEGTVGVAGLVA